MLKRFQRGIAIMLSLAAAMMFYTTAPAAQAGLLSTAKVSLSNPIAGGSSTYTFSYTTTGTRVIKGIRMAWRSNASATTDNPGATVSSATLGSQPTGTGIDTSGWTIDLTDAATNVVYIVNATATTAAAGTVVYTISNVTNPAIVESGTNGCLYNGTNDSAGTCFLRVQTYDTESIATMQAQTAGNIIDYVTLPMEVVAAATVTATVDPVLTFTVTGVASSQSANGQTTSITTTYNDMPFSYLTAGTPKYAAQDLAVKTNAYNGYTVTLRMYDDMTGTYPANNIDPFIGTDSGGTWSAPEAWEEPTSTTGNTNTGWIGAHTADTDVWGGGNAGKWGPVEDVANQVMSSATPDDGSSTVRVSYAIEVNVYQPSDKYTGYIRYNCIPTY